MYVEIRCRVRKRAGVSPLDWLEKKGDLVRRMSLAQRITHLFFFLTTGGSRAATIAWLKYCQQSCHLTKMQGDNLALLTSSNTFFNPR